MGALAVPLMIGGTLLQAAGQIQAGNAAKNVANANAQIALQEAAAKRDSAKYEGLKLSRERNDLMEQQRRVYGAAGVEGSTGTPLETMMRTAAEYERDIGMTGIAANNAMLKGENEASIYQYMGKQQQTAGWFGAGSTLLSGFGKAFYGGGGKFF